MNLSKIEGVKCTLKDAVMTMNNIIFSHAAVTRGLIVITKYTHWCV